MATNVVSEQKENRLVHVEDDTAYSLLETNVFSVHSLVACLFISVRAVMVTIVGGCVNLLNLISLGACILLISDYACELTSSHRYKV